MAFIEIIPRNTNIQFMKFRYIWFVISLTMVVYSIFTWFRLGDARYGVDFRGGVELVVHFEQPIDISEIRTVLAQAGHKGAVVQAFGKVPQEFSIRAAADQNETSNGIKDVFSKLEGKKFEIKKEEFVGPVIGDQIRKDGIISFVISLIGILLFVTIRFDFSFALGAVIALLHDATIATGVYLACGHEFTAATLAAILTIVGYSVNDTIIVYDRIRENISKTLKKSPRGLSEEGGLAKLIDLSINETLSRTILTSLTVFFVCLSLWLLGEGAIVELSFALLVGVIVGTYSSIFIASPTVVALQRGK